MLTPSEEGLVDEDENDRSDTGLGASNSHHDTFDDETYAESKALADEEIASADTINEDPLKPLC
jgi:hypothetical protein